MKTVVAGVLIGLFAVIGLGCKKKAAAPVPTPTPDASGGGSSQNTNYVSGGGAAQNVRLATKRTVALNDMHTLGIAITQWELDNNRMPSVAETKQLLAQYPNILAVVNDGTIVLTGTAERGGLWAYEVDADTRGGIGLVGGTASRYDATAIKQYLGK